MNAEHGGAGVMRYVLAPGVQFIPGTAMGPAMRARLQLEPGDVAVSRAESQTATRIIDHEAARLLRCFATPRRVADAVAEYCRATDADPTQTLVDACHFLATLADAGILRRLGERPPDPPLAPGEAFGPYVIVRTLQRKEDVEVCEGRDARGAPYALKIGRRGTTHASARSLLHEAAILHRLNGARVPRLIAQGLVEGRPYLVLEWIEADIISAVAEAYRFAGEGSTARLLNLCQTLAHAYADLHERGVIHGDVQPRNVLTGPDGTVTLLDFGLARTDESNVEGTRGGIDFYLEPEAARPALAGEPWPPPSRAGEQYAVAALLYVLVTGRPYLPFRLERRQAWQQIVAERPLTFAEQGQPAWPALEAVLGRALAKESGARYASMAAFARRLDAVTPPGRRAGPPATASRRMDTSTDTYLRGVLNRLRDVDAPAGLVAPTASVGFGAAGIAYVFYRAALIRDDGESLDAADRWCQVALRRLPELGAFQSAALHLGARTAPPGSLLYGEAGVHLVRMLIGRARDDAREMRSGLRDFLAVAMPPAVNRDLASGLAGTLAGCALLAETLAGSAVRVEALAATGEHLDAALRNETATDRADAGGPAYLGLLHGEAGTLYARLRWAEACGRPPDEALRARLEHLAGRAILSGAGSAWPLTRTGGGALAGICHGSAGYVLLWRLAYRLLGDHRYAVTAERAAEHTWARRMATLPHLCCGLAGQAMALLSVAALTSDRRWRQRAHVLAGRAVVYATAEQARPNSLIKGDVGVALLLLDLERPQHATAPLLERED